MKIHRFYVGDLHDKRGPVEMTHELWVNDTSLVNQWLKVLRLRVGEQIVLFDGIEKDRLYRIIETDSNGVKLQLVTEQERVLPKRHAYLFWSLLKKDNNDLVLQKCTELGISNFVPLLCERTEKTGFDVERAMRIVIEAAEQCGRSDIPHVREPIGLSEAINEYSHKITLFVADQSGTTPAGDNNPVGVLIGPEGGWSENERALFSEYSLHALMLSDHILRAETASIVAAQIMQGLV